MTLVRIYRPAKNAMQSGTARTKTWIVDFEQTEPRQVEPLMGWTSSGDMKQQLTIRFDTREEAASTKEKIVKANLTVPIIRVSKEENQSAAAETPVKLISTNSKAPSKRVGIEISNGNGVNRMARKVGDYLKTQGHEVRRLTNAKNFNYGKSKVFYQEGHSQEARHIADHHGVGPGIDGAHIVEREGIAGSSLDVDPVLLPLII